VSLFTDEWKERWPNFHPLELACKCCRKYYHDAKFLDKLQSLRYLADKPFTINSGHRCAKHNKSVGGAARSQHLKIAVDVALRGHDRFMLADLANTYGFSIGYGATFIHLDLRKNKTSWYYPDSEQYWKRPQ
jgi:zinc D-Ala-D-Ala carboxypeptidase